MVFSFSFPEVSLPLIPNLLDFFGCAHLLVDRFNDTRVHYQRTASAIYWFSAGIAVSSFLMFFLAAYALVEFYEPFLQLVLLFFGSAISCTLAVDALQLVAAYKQMKRIVRPHNGALVLRGGQCTASEPSSSRVN